MVRAHSLLYAIYICLIVSIICAALLYFSNLFTQLNLHYNIREALYINNQSAVNFALGTQLQPEAIPDDDSGITASCHTTPYGLLTVLLATSSVKNDTVASAHLVGSFSSDKAAVRVSKSSNRISYFGQVSLTGDCYVPEGNLQQSYVLNKPGKLTMNGKLIDDVALLPEINPDFKRIYENIAAEKIALKDADKPNDSIYYNSFFNKTKEISLVGPVVGNIIFKGNFILRSKDSILIKKNAILEDVILIAPKITFEQGFSGTIQAFATHGIEMEEKVSLKYPSVVCVYSQSKEQTSIKIGKGCHIKGAVVLFGNGPGLIDNNTVEIEEGGMVLGDVYCSGKLWLKSNVYGTVYTNRFFYRTKSGIYENMIADIAINPAKRPVYFIAIPLFPNKKNDYGILKKVL